MRKIIPASAGLLLLLPSLCLAQVTVTRAVIVDIPFAFYAGEKMLPAGTYEIEGTNQEGELKLIESRTQRTAMVQVFTRISQRDRVEVVFDRTADKNYLSEVYMPGMDGFLIQGAPVRHTHTVLKAKIK